MWGYLFEPGRQYLVYAGRTPRDGRFRCVTAPDVAAAQGPCEWDLETSICSRTARLENATDDLEALGPPIIDHLERRAQRLTTNTE